MILDVLADHRHHRHGGHRSPTSTSARWPWISRPSILPADEQRRAHRGAGRGWATAAPLWEPPPPDGLLAGGPWVRTKKLEAHWASTPWAILPAAPWASPGDCHNEALLYKLFGVNAELLIDHAWGWEILHHGGHQGLPIHSTNSVGSGQVLHLPLSLRSKARLIVREMADALALALVDKGLCHRPSSTLTVGYDRGEPGLPGGPGGPTGAPAATDHLRAGPIPQARPRHRLPGGVHHLLGPADHGRRPLALFERIASEKPAGAPARTSPPAQVLPQGAQPFCRMLPAAGPVHRRGRPAQAKQDVEASVRPREKRDAGDPAVHQEKVR